MKVLLLALLLPASVLAASDADTAWANLEKLRQGPGQPPAEAPEQVVQSMRAHLAAQEREYRRVFWDWFSEKLGPQTELLRYCVGHEDADRTMRQQTREEAIAANEAKDFFIEHGRVPDPWQYRKKSIAV
jgi:hypothetical protein